MAKRKKQHTKPKRRRASLKKLDALTLAGHGLVTGFGVASTIYGASLLALTRQYTAVQAEVQEKTSGLFGGLLYHGGQALYGVLLPVQDLLATARVIRNNELGPYVDQVAQYTQLGLVATSALTAYAGVQAMTQATSIVSDRARKKINKQSATTRTAVGGTVTAAASAGIYALATTPSLTDVVDHTTQQITSGDDVTTLLAGGAGLAVYGAVKGTTSLAKSVYKGVRKRL